MDNKFKIAKLTYPFHNLILVKQFKLVFLFLKFFFIEFQFITSALNNFVLYHQSKTPIGLRCRQRLNPKSFIQPPETLHAD